VTLSVALVGAGGIGETHAHNLHDAPGADLEAVCDVDGDRAEALAAAVDARAYADHGEAFDAVDPDAVYVATPPRTHAEVATAAARRGCAVFCEKPLAATLADGREIVAAVEDSGVPFVTGFCLRFAPPCQRLRALLDDGIVGDPVSVVASRAGWGVPGGDDWRTDPGQACGITVESASHNLDALRWLGGEVADVSGVTTNVTHPDLAAFDDNVVATARFDSGAIGLVANSWTSRVEHLRLGVVGTEGAAVLEGDGWWRLDRLTYATGTARHATTLAFDDATATDMGYRAETDAFLDAVRADATPPADARDGLRALELSHAILGG
jgi:myo-inositol 2-dehydrogenase/D-chiro-inositol 1-dehydrogenase